MTRFAASLAIVCALVTVSAAERVAGAPRRPPSACRVAVHKKQLDVDGQNATRQRVVIVCKRSMRANVAFDKDYSKSLWKALEKDFKAAKITYSNIASSHDCSENPLAAGCL